MGCGPLLCDSRVCGISLRARGIPVGSGGIEQTLERDRGQRSCVYMFEGKGQSVTD